MHELSARGERFPSHCNLTGKDYERYVDHDVGPLIRSAGWQRADLSPSNTEVLTPAADLFRQGLSLYPGFGIGISSRFEGIYFNADHPNRLLHVETSGSPAGKPLGGFAKSCTMHKADSRLQMTWKIGLAVDVAITGVLISNYLPAPNSVAAATLTGLLDVVDVVFVLTGPSGQMIRTFSPSTLRDHMTNG